ncbi:unnamed protein product [Effrenium voratum]|nr:unnamed protein product [Effrenium voratum]
MRHVPHAVRLQCVGGCAAAAGRRVGAGGPADLRVPAEPVHLGPSLCRGWTHSKHELFFGGSLPFSRLLRQFFVWLWGFGDEVAIQRLARPHPKSACRMPCREASTLLDRFAHQVFWFHARRLELSSVPPGSGAELWVQRRGPEQPPGERGMDWHFDKDEDLLDREDVLVMPKLSTVTYLSSTGAPLLVLSQPVLKEGELQPIEGQVTAFLTRPVSGRHVAFDGRLLHGCPARFASRGERLSLSVNLWFGHKPLGVVSSESLRARLSREGVDPMMELSTSEDLFTPGDGMVVKQHQADGGIDLPVDFGPWHIAGLRVPSELRGEDLTTPLALLHDAGQVQLGLPVSESPPRRRRRRR